jgi:hypothetical protein
MVKYERTYINLLTGHWTTNSDFIVQDAVNHAIEKLAVIALAASEGVFGFEQERKQWMDALKSYYKRTGKQPQHITQ